MKPRILLYDIETKPNVSYTWGRFDQNVIGIKETWGLLSVAWKWLGEKEIHCETIEGNKTDLKLCEILYDILCQADITVAHNGDDFDNKKVRARMLVHGMKPLPTITSIDTKKVAKKYFKFDSNSLNDLARELGLGAKFQTGGFDLWLGCMAGKKAAWAKMKKYNIQDVSLLEKVYKKLVPWIEKNHLIQMTANQCPKCGSDKIRRDGIKGTLSQIRQQWECLGCRSFFLTSIRRGIL